MSNSLRTLCLVAASILALFGQSPNRHNPVLWAAIGIAEPLVVERPDYGLNISFALLNESNLIADTHFESWKITINGKELPDSHWIFGNGPGPADGWARLRSGESFIFGKTLPLGEYFPKAGIYEVAWKGAIFSARPVVLRVLPLKK